MRDGAPWVCLHVREPAYLDQVHGGRDWSYHDYRNASIQDYLLAAEELARRGNVVVRMGANVTEPLQPAHPRIIDYAMRGRTDFLDIFLSAHCRFFIGDTSGFLWVPMLFRRPVVIVNNVPLEYIHSWGPDDLSIPKMLWWREEQRFLTFREIIESGVGRFLTTPQYEQGSLELRSNTPEEIKAVAVEMDERLKGTWQGTQTDAELQRRFWSLFPPSHLNRVIRASIGAEFLRQHHVLLDGVTG
jgi:putative glycosyltransferase (TIGR04372 family)